MNDSTALTLKPEQLGRLLESALGGLVPSNTPSVSISQDPEKALRNRILTKVVVDKVREAESSNQQLLKKCAYNTEYFSDNQSAAWNPFQNTLVRNYPQASQAVVGDQHAISINIFKPAIVAIVSRFQSTHPNIIIKPGSTQEEVTEACRVAQRVISEYEWERQDMREVMAEFVPNLILHGSTVLKTVWNRRAGKSLGKQPVPALDKDGNPIPAIELDPLLGTFVEKKNEDGSPVWQSQIDGFGRPVVEETWEGQVETSVVLLKDFYADPTATKFRAARWCIHRYDMSPADVYDKWGIEVPGYSSTPNADYGFALRRGQPPVKNVVTIYEAWFKPGTYKFGGELAEKKTYPKGYVIITTDDTLIQEGENPNDHGEFPFTFIPCYRVPGQMYGDTMANSLRVLQNSFNKTASAITRANDLMGNPQWLIPNGCKMPDQDRVNRGGIHRRYEPDLNGKGPEMVPGVGVSPSVWRYWDSLRVLFQEVSGVKEGGLAGGSGQVESGKALSALIERDMSKLAGIGDEIGRGIIRWSWLTLKLIQQHWDQRRLISVAGHYQVAEIVSFGGVDVHDSFTITVTSESTMPQTQAIKQAKADSLLDRQLIAPFEYLKRIGEDSAEEFSREALEIANARMENASARRSGIVPIELRPDVESLMEIENHEIHIAEHDKELLNPALRKDPARYLALYNHRKHHEMYANQIMQAQMQQQALLAQMGTKPNQNSDPANAGQPTPPPPPGGPLPQGKTRR